VLETRDLAPTGPAALARAGVKFAFYSGGVERAADLRKAIKKAVDAGLSKDEALKALTLYPAQIFGLDDRLGSLEPGKIANLTVIAGDLFDDRAKLKFTVIDGVKYEPAPEAAPETNR
jgi:imidazolonepropionase-like amidohydrolase